MTVIASGTGRASQTAPRAGTSHSPHQARVAREDAGAMRQALDRAGGLGKDGKPARAGRQDRLADAKLDKTPLPLRQKAQDPEAMALTRHDERRSALFDDGDQDRQPQSLALGATAQAPVQPIAVPDMPAPHVDAAAFAQLMTQLWLRERGKGAKEVRVSFGDDAWPATGARLVRNAAGTLDVQLHVADGGALYQADTLSGLGRQLTDSGLALGALSLADGAVA
jgi:hypothetical protein